MADNSVYITGAASGAFTQALNDLPPWATENTALAIERLLRKSLDIQTKSLSKLVKGAIGGGGTTGTGTARTQSELTKALREYNKALEAAKQDAKKRAKDNKDKGDKDLVTGKKLQSKNEKLIFVLGGLDKIGSKIQDAMKQNFKTYTELQQGGINVVAGLDNTSNGFTALQQITALTGVRFTELSATMLKYSTAVNAFTTGKFSNTVKAASLDLYKFGFTNKESAELLGSYLEAQAGYTDMANKTTAETAVGLTKFGSNLTKLSMVTGMARTAILANMEAISKSNEASVLSANIGEDAATSTLEFISSMKDQNVGRAFLKMMTDQVKPLNATFMGFQKIGLGGFGQKMMTFTQSLKGMDPARAAIAIREFEKQNHAAIEAGKQQANLYSQIPELAGEANAALTMFNGLQQQARTMANLNEKDLAKMEASNKARSRLSSEWEKLMSHFQKMFSAPISMLNGLATALGWANTMIDKFTGWLDSFGEETSSWVGVGLVISGFGAALLKGKMMLETFFSIFSKGGSAISGIISKTFGAIGSIGGLVLRFAGILGSLYAAFEIGQSIGTAIYDFISKFDIVNSAFDKVFGGITSIFSSSPSSAPVPSAVSVPTAPAPSKIDSPSAGTNTKKEEATSTASTTTTPTTSSGPGIEKPPSSTDINSMMAFQNNLTQQILLSIESLVSVNKDILRYTRSHT